MSEKKSETENSTDAGGVRIDFEIRRLWRLVTEADKLISAVVYADNLDELGLEPFDDRIAQRWLDRASIVSPGLREIVFPDSGQGKKSNS